ncbi:hypothetical protein E2C01_089862 [Portunus trituberculatus]|uniref:Uncharacterized protein n=1 Tax=Portunus trituberculatus TaxID=210409 RepID=A0A5B7JJX9_PORTR|nr:hypothetical protein [Portunus trituberculatus]
MVSLCGREKKKEKKKRTTDLLAPSLYRYWLRRGWCDPSDAVIGGEKPTHTHAYDIACVKNVSARNECKPQLQRYLMQEYHDVSSVVAPRSPERLLLHRTDACVVLNM